MLGNADGAYELYRHSVEDAQKPREAQPTPPDGDVPRGPLSFLQEAKAWGLPSKSGPTHAGIVLEHVEMDLAIAAPLGASVVTLESIESLKPKAGNGTKAMEKLVELADRNWVTLALKPTPFPSRTGELMPAPVLKKFYEKHGFQTRFTVTHGYSYMFRYPKYGR